MLVHAFITAQLDYCSSLYAGLQVGWLQCLDRVLCSAARLSGRIPKCGHVSSYMATGSPSNSGLHAMMLYNCLSLVVPSGPRSDLSSRPLLPWVFHVIALCSAVLGFLIITFACRTTKQNRVLAQGSL